MRYLIIILFLIITGSFSTNAQVITTIAGNGSVAHTGDGGMATSAGIGGPYGCAADLHGNFYFSEGSGGDPTWIRKVTPCGIISTVVGTGVDGYNGDSILAISAQLNEPLGIAFDSANNMYIADTHNNRIRRVDAATGIITTVAGNGIEGFSGNGGAATAAMLNQPGNVCLDRFGNIYIEDNGNFMIRRVNTSGVISTYVGTGAPGYTGDGGPADSAEIADNYGICTDTFGNLYFGMDFSFDSFKLRKVDTMGIITTIAGNGLPGPSGDGGLADSAGIEFFGVCFDHFGN